MSRLPAFKIDENLPREAAELFKSSGIDACHVLDQGMGGIDDFDLAKACAGERRAILTLDLDFAEPTASIRRLITKASWVLRLANEARANVVAVLRNVLELLASAITSWPAVGDRRRRCAGSDEGAIVVWASGDE